MAAVSVLCFVNPLAARSEWLRFRKDIIDFKFPEYT